MKTHKVKDVGLAGHLDGTPDTFKTWCGISDMDNPSEELTENLVCESEECTCKKCQRAYDAETYLLVVPDVGSTVSFYTYDITEVLVDTGKVLKIIENSEDKSDPILKIKPNNMRYNEVYRAVSELANEFK